MSTIEDFTAEKKANAAKIAKLEKEIEDLEKESTEETERLKAKRAQWTTLTQANEKLTAQIVELEKEKTKQGSAMDERFAQLNLSQNDNDGVWAFWSDCCKVQDDDLQGGTIKFPGGFLGNPNLGTSLFVRPCYPPLRNVVLQSFEKLPQFALLGNPGIGKTYFGFYLLVWFARQGKTVIYDHGVKKRRYLFSPEGVAVGGFSSFLGQLDSKDVFYIADAVKPDGCGGKTILITSPRHDIYYTWSKDYTRQRFMPVWTSEEIEKCRTLLYSDVEEKDSKAALAKWGGIPRRVLQNPTEPKNDVNLEAAIYRVDQSLFSTSVGTTDYSEVSHRLLHIVPDETTFDFRSLKFASPHVLEKVTVKLLQDARHSLKVFLNSSAGFGQMASLRGVLFEQVAHQILAAGGTFRVRELSEQGQPRGETALTLPRNMETVVFDERPQPGQILDGKYYQPRIKVFPCVDSFTGRNVWFQMTVSPDHKPSHQHIEELMDNLQPTKPKLYFVVPEDIFPNFRFQKYTTQKNTIFLNVSPKVQRVTQYALCLKITN